MWRKSPAQSNIEKDHISSFWPTFGDGIDAAYEVENKDTLFIFKGNYLEKVILFFSNLRYSYFSWGDLIACASDPA